MSERHDAASAIARLRMKTRRPPRSSRERSILDGDGEGALGRHRQVFLVIAKIVCDRIDVLELLGIKLFGDVLDHREIRERARRALVDAEKLAVLDGRQFAPALTRLKGLQLLTGIRGLHRLPHRQGSRVLVVLTTGNKDRVRFGSQNLFRIDRSPPFDEWRRNVVAAGGGGHGAPHVLAVGEGIFGRALIAELDIDLWLRFAGLRNAIGDVLQRTGIKFRDFVAALFLPGQLAKKPRGGDMPLDRLRVVVDHDDRNALFFQTVGIEAKRLVLPVRQDHEIGIEAENFLDGEGLCLDFAYIGNIGKGSAVGKMHFPVGGHPALPGLARNPNDGIIGLLTANSHVVFEIEAKNDTFCRKINLDLTADDIRDGLFRRFGGRHDQEG
ncbi:hypothetical protein AT6N2_C1099 [Agrobacterium tumefaciens]|nr:hypothetical protein AT6N2_C1099 [Agrobacterium tumefaciens]